MEQWGGSSNGSVIPLDAAHDYHADLFCMADVPRRAADKHVLAELCASAISIDWQVPIGEPMYKHQNLLIGIPTVPRREHLFFLFVFGWPAVCESLQRWKPASTPTCS